MKNVVFTCLTLLVLGSNACTLKDRDGNNAPRLKCYFFFIPDCPASINNIGKLNLLNNKYHKDVEFIGILSEPNFKVSQLDSVNKSYSINFKVIIDDSLKIAEQHGASITPEFFLYNEELKLIYTGAMDDYYYTVGKHRNKTTENYLEDAIKSAKKKDEVQTKSTLAYGCRINLDYFN
jgi:hypothetical protein